MTSSTRFAEQARRVAIAALAACTAVTPACSSLGAPGMAQEKSMTGANRGDSYEFAFGNDHGAESEGGGDDGGAVYEEAMLADVATAEPASRERRAENGDRAPAAPPGDDEGDASKSDGVATGGGSTPGPKVARPEPKVREEFPETLFWAPAVITGADGRAEIVVPLADSITDWRVEAIASDRRSGLGTATSVVKVDQEITADLECPTVLSQADRITARLTLDNRLEADTKIRLRATLLGSGSGDASEPPAIAFAATAAITPEVVTVPARGRANATVELIATRPGIGKVLIEAIAVETDEVSDRVIRAIEVRPRGRPIVESTPVVVSDDGVIDVEVAPALGADVEPGSEELLIRIYPRASSYILEGLERFATYPTGCFEQTTSRSFAALVVLETIRAERPDDPIVAELQDMVATGYQKLLAHEVGGSGAFVPFARAGETHQTWLTAYALLLITGMERSGVEVDPAVIERLRRFLERNVPAWSVGDDDATLDLASLSSWALLEAASTARAASQAAAPEPGAAGEKVEDEDEIDEDAIARAARQAELAASCAASAKNMLDAVTNELRNRRGKATSAYSAALALCALVSSGREPAELRPARDALDAALARQTGEPGVWRRTLAGSSGAELRIAGLALGAWGLARLSERLDDRAAEEAAATARDYGREILARRAPQGGWGSTETTLWSVRALRAIAALGGEDALALEGDEGPVEVTATLDGQPVGSIVIAPDAASSVHLLSIGHDALMAADRRAAGPNAERDSIRKLRVTLGDVRRARPLGIEVVRRHRVRWAEAADPSLQAGDVAVSVRPAATKVRLGQEIPVEVTVKGTRRDGFGAPMIARVGMPATIRLVQRDLEALVADGRIDRFEIHDREAVLYLDAPSQDEPFRATLRARAETAGTARAPASEAFEYYRPTARAVFPPWAIEVLPEG